LNASTATNLRSARVGADIEASGSAGTFLAADLSALAEVGRLAGAVRAAADRLVILINNAGIGTAGPRQTSGEGFELRFAVNYLAGFLLTSLLLPPCQKERAGADRGFMFGQRAAAEVDALALTGLSCAGSLTRNQAT
jgi:NAD(P)-dependent dehydrogenase (short-subunit alcohol dehydrogenase family)